MARPKKHQAAPVQTGMPNPIMPAAELKASNGKVQIAVQIDPKARNFLNVVANLEGKSQAEIVEGLITNMMQTYNLQARVNEMMAG